MPVKVPLDTNSRSSASAVDADDHLQGQAAAEAEARRIADWASPSFAPGKNQAQLDDSYGYKEKRTGK